MLGESLKHQEKVPADSRKIQLQEKRYQKEGKISLAHRPLIEESLDSWIPMFNTPLFCIQHPEGYWIVQDFCALNKKEQFGTH